MTTFDTIVVVLALLYLLEIHHWLPQSALLLRAGIGGYRVITAQQGFVWGASQVVVRGGWFPWSVAFALDPRPFRLDGADVRPGPGFAVWPGAPPAQTPALPLSEEHLPSSEQNTIVFGEGHSWKTSSEEAAQIYVALLRSLAPLGEAERAEALRRWEAERTDGDTLRRLHDDFRREGRLLAAPCTALFVLVFGVAVAAALEVWPALPWRELGGGYLFLIGVIQLLFFSAHAEHAPSATHTRWVSVLTMLLNPAAAMVAVQTLGRSRFAGHEPLAVARVLLSPAQLAPFEDRYLRSKRFGSWLSTDDADGADHELAAPPPQDGSVCYCPRCLAQYTAPRPECTDCSGVATVDIAGEPGVLPPRA